MTARAVLLGLLLAAPPGAAGADRAVPRRIISLAPSVTETLFALGLGERVAGVTDYCDYPRAAARLPRVGGYITPNYEAVAALRPDLAVLLPEHADVRPKIAALGVEILPMDSRSVQGILDGMRRIGGRCGDPERAARLTEELEAGLSRVGRAAAGRPRPRVFLCVGRAAGPGGLRSLHAAGPGGLHHDLILRAGGANAVPPGPASYPLFSAEAVLRLDPDVIVEFAPRQGDPAALRREWGALRSLSAVRGDRVFVFTHDFLSVPGPRLVRFIEDLARALHPDAPWGNP